MENLKLENTNIVILAKSHNPSIVTKDWLLAKKIIDEKITNFANTPIFSHTETDNLIIFLDPNRLQFTVKNTSPDNIKQLPIIVEKYVNQLPETPYTAIGFNFMFNFSCGKNLKTLFSKEDERFEKLFTVEYQIDGILRFKFKDFMVQIILKQEAQDKIIADFNFNFDGNDVNKIKGKLKEYAEVNSKAVAILEGLFNA